MLSIGNFFLAQILLSLWCFGTELNGPIFIGVHDFYLVVQTSGGMFLVPRLAVCPIRATSILSKQAKT